MTNLTTLQPHHTEAMALFLEGKKKQEIAETLHVRPETVSRWFGDPTFIERYAEMRAAWENEYRDIRLATTKARLIAAQEEHDLLEPSEGMDTGDVIAAVRVRSRLRQEVREEVERLQERLQDKQTGEPAREVQAQFSVADSVPLAFRVEHYMRELELHPDTPASEVCRRFDAEGL